ncbi:MAG: prepilin peptidase [Chthoniobacterales bacterium]
MQSFASLPPAIALFFVFIFGGIIGSFLNACIHRMPRGIKLHSPRRSFCPSCKKALPWYFNLPIISYLALRGRCGFCKTPIPFRYLLVELITVAFFVAVWLHYSFPIFFAYWIFCALMIGATFIDIDHLIIPDEFTWGGIVLGILFSFAIPEIMDANSRLIALFTSLGSAALGFFLLWGVVELGKIAFGRKKITLDSEETFTWIREGETAHIRIGDEILQWEEIFSRTSDQLILECSSLDQLAESEGPGKLVFYFDRCLFNEKTYNLDDLDTFSGKVTQLIIPREAMGFGDVKFLGAIGAFLGWKAVFYTLFTSSVIGCFAGIALMLFRRQKNGIVIPFGPYLAIGALTWLFGGQTLWNWYFRFF